MSVRDNEPSIEFKGVYTGGGSAQKEYLTQWDQDPTAMKNWICIQNEFELVELPNMDTTKTPEAMLMRNFFGAKKSTTILECYISKPPPPHTIKS